MLLITCAYGKVGRQIVPYLAKKGFDIRAIDMNPDIKKLEQQGVKETLVGDSRDPKFVAQAMKGVDQVLYIPPQFTYQEAKMGRIAIDAAIDAKVSKYVYLSCMYPNMSTLLQHRMKAKDEQYLLYRGFESGLDWSVLRPSTYHQNIFMKMFYDMGEYPSMCDIDKLVSWVDPLDVADCAIKMLTEDGYKYAIYTCSNESMTPRDVATIMTKVSGKEITPISVPEDKLVEYWPDYFAGSDSFATETFYALRKTYNKWGWAGNNKQLIELLDHKPRSVANWCARQLVANDIKPTISVEDTEKTSNSFDLF